MSYYTGQNKVGTHSVDVLPRQGRIAREVPKARKTGKWPLWRTVLGVTVVCSLFWGTVLALIF